MSPELYQAFLYLDEARRMLADGFPVKADHSLAVVQQKLRALAEAEKAKQVSA